MAHREREGHESDVDSVRHMIGVNTQRLEDILTQGFNSLAELVQNVPKGLSAEMNSVYAQITERPLVPVPEVEAIVRNKLGTILHEYWPGSSCSHSDVTLEEELRRRISQLQADCVKADEENKNLRQERDGSARDTTRMRKQLQESGSQLQKLKSQSSMYRQIIIDNGEDDGEPMDDVVVKSFKELRDLIQKMVHKFYHASTAVLLQKSPLFEKQKEFLDHWKNLPDSGRKLRVRAKVFDLLKDDIINKPCFGLPPELEDNLGRMESLLNKRCRDKVSEVDEWRKRTVQCASWLDLQSNKPKKAGDLIYDFMRPIQAPAPPKGSARDAFQDRIDESITELCEKALKLELLLRQSKHGYTCRDIPPGTLVDDSDESEMAPQAFEPPQPGVIQGSRVAFTLFGALIKYTNPAKNEWKVLEKAQVVCRM